MTAAADSVFSVLKSHRLETPAAAAATLQTTAAATGAGAAEGADPTLDGQASSGSTEAYFAKYLTSARLLDLQLADSSFRRQVLTQFLIMFRYLCTPTKFKRKQHELTSTQRAWIASAETRVWDLLAATPPNGAAFTAAIRHLLQREADWIAWKNEGCKNFERKRTAAEAEAEDNGEAPSETAATDDIKSVVGGTRATIAATKRARHALGTRELSRLWALSADDLQPARDVEPPNVADFFEESIEQMDPEAQVERHYWSINNPNFCWRALRLLTKHRLHYTKDGISHKSMSEYLQAAIERLGKEVAADDTEAAAEAKAGSASAEGGADAKAEDDGCAPPVKEATV